jgi:hypothetical protein
MTHATSIASSRYELAGEVDGSAWQPTEAEWRLFSLEFPRSTGKNWTWIGDLPGVAQYRKSTFYLDNRARGLPAGMVRVLPPGHAQS